MTRFKRLLARGAVLALIASTALPAAEALAAPAVRLLNPSGYSATLRLSDKEDSDESYHLSAWVSEVPSNPLVEFELGTATLPSIASATGTRVGNDTWEADFELADVTDGQYQLRAILYEGFVGPGTGNEVTRTEEVVTVNAADVPPPPESETVEITSPVNGGQLGFYTPPGKKANALIEAETSDGADQVRALYTLSDPGKNPEWVECGSGAVEDREVRVRCTLADDGPAARVRAVALVANSTPAPGSPVAAADETGDVHRIVPYVQVPSSVNMTPDSAKTTEATCFTVSATVLDEKGADIAGVNVDVHAQGPDDQFKFANMRGTSNGFQPPDKAHGGIEPTAKCADTDPEGSQGDHNVPGASDEKHIESTGGTGTDGSFTFVLRSSTRGGTLVTAWADLDDDDLQGATEVSGGSQIGWGTEPPEAPKQLILDPRTAAANTGDCQKLIAVAKQGGDPLGFREIDVHATGPEGIAFCTPEGGSSATPADAPGHAGGYHQDGTGHIEGQTNGEGTFVFGVTSGREGTTDLLVWLDNDGDDVFDSNVADEIFTTGQIGWGGETKRVSTNLTIRYSGGTFSGKAKSGRADCRNKRSVSIHRKKRGRDPVVGSDVTNKPGEYSVRVRKAKGTYYAKVAQKSFIDDNGDNVICQRDKSDTVRVR